MQDLDTELHRLQKPEPSAKFCRQAKERLMNKICLFENETWFARLLRKISPVMPSEHFIQAAKVRLMARIEAAKRPVLGRSSTSFEWSSTSFEWLSTTFEPLFARGASLWRGRSHGCPRQ